MSCSAPSGDLRTHRVVEGAGLRPPPPSSYYSTMPNRDTVIARERQNRTAYRYGLCLVCLGVLLNWLGFYERALAPIRYLGLGCVVGGGLLICGVMCRTLGASRRAREAADSQGSNRVPSIHALGLEYSIPRPSTKPPDYYSTVGSDPNEPPPSYDEALRTQSSTVNNRIDEVSLSMPDPCQHPPTTTTTPLLNSTNTTPADTTVIITSCPSCRRRSSTTTLEQQVPPNISSSTSSLPPYSSRPPTPTLGGTPTSNPGPDNVISTTASTSSS